MIARDYVDQLIELSIEATSNIGASIIEQFELEKTNYVLSEREFVSFKIFSEFYYGFIPVVVSLYHPQSPTSLDKVSEISGSEAFKPLDSSGSYGTSSNQQRAPSDWSLTHKLFENPRLLFGLVSRKCTKELKDILRNFSEDIKYFFSKQLFEIVVNIIKNSLSLLRRRLVGPQTSKGLHSVTIPGTLTLVFENL